MRRRTGAIALLSVTVLLAAVVGWVALEFRAPVEAAGAAVAPAQAEGLAARGAALARIGNCAGCHTARDGADYAGGRAIETPFGVVHAANLTPHDATGLGRWTADDLWRALHHGRSRDGRLLYPACPYPNFTLVRREDSDAIHAWLRSLPPVDRAQRPPALRFPYDSAWALAAWRRLYFRPGRFEPDPQRSAAWNHGAYLTEGLAHCRACHVARDALGGSTGGGGGRLAGSGWYAPALESRQGASVAHWSLDETVALLRDGRHAGAVASGPMAQVVLNSSSQWADEDLRAVATYLQSLPVSEAPAVAVAPAPAERLARGAAHYERLCADCHGKAGEGAPPAWPALAGNRTVTADPPVNLVRIVLEGGFGPATARHPRPYGMPPFATELDDAALADLLSFLRASWGHDAAAVSPLEVRRWRDPGSD